MKGPKLTIDDRDYERAKYEEIWRYSDYRQYSPGLKYSERLDLLSILHQNKIRSILDVGCGMGKVISLLLEQGGDPFEVEGFDIAHNCLNPEIVEQGVKLQVGCLWDEGVIDKKFDATICTDVMEHIPTDKVDASLRNICACTEVFSFLSIALFYDRCGPKFLNEDLHLTVQEPAWWLKRIEDAGFTVSWHEVLDLNELSRVLLLLVQPASTSTAMHLPPPRP